MLFRLHHARLRPPSGKMLSEYPTFRSFTTLKRPCELYRFHAPATVAIANHQQPWISRLKWIKSLWNEKEWKRYIPVKLSKLDSVYIKIKIKWTLKYLLKYLQIWVDRTFRSLLRLARLLQMSYFPLKNVCFTKLVWTTQNIFARTNVFPNNKDLITLFDMTTHIRSQI